MIMSPVTARSILGEKPSRSWIGMYLGFSKNAGSPTKCQQKDTLPFVSKARTGYITYRNTKREEKKRATRKANQETRKSLGFDPKIAKARKSKAQAVQRTPLPPPLPAVTPPSSPSRTTRGYQAKNLVEQKFTNTTASLK